MKLLSPDAVSAVKTWGGGGAAWIRSWTPSTSITYSWRLAFNSYSEMEIISWSIFFIVEEIILSHKVHYATV